MDLNIEKECSALGGLFQQIMNDMKQSTPVWEDFLSKSSKLHNTIRSTLLATTAWLDAFQKLADLATASRGATREIGSALTRLCMRHRSIEGKLKAFSSCLLDVLVVPMQERMEEWKKTSVILDKDHAKDYKKARADIKKASSDTIRLQKKVKKGKSDVQSRLDSALHEVNEKYQVLEETEKNAVRNALIEERSRFCMFISCLKPVVDEEIHMLTEVTHLQEILQHLCLQASDPAGLPAASEQVILDLKVTGGVGWTYQTPPSSPSSLGSRKSSMCSISSINSSSSGGTNMSSPGHNFRNRNSSLSLPPGMVRLSSVSSQDSGFTSQEAVCMRPPSPGVLAITKSSLTDSNGSGTDSNATTPSPSYPSSSVSTWSNWPDPPSAPYSQQEGGVERPHTISTAYEKSHNRPALTSQLFEPPEPGVLSKQQQQQQQHQQQMEVKQNSHYAVPCINNIKTASVKGKEKNYDTVDYKPPIPGPKPRGKPVAPPMVPDFGNKLQHDPNRVVQHPVYVNQDDLAKMAVEMEKCQGRHEDIPEEDEEEEVTTPTAHYAGETSGALVQSVHSVPSQDGSITPTDDLDIASLSRIIDDLSASTTALQGLGEQDRGQVKVTGSTEELDKTACELSAAIKELEASTAALEIYHDNNVATNNRNSIQCSSGYGTMNSTPTVSEDTISSDLVETLTNIDAELEELTRDKDRYATLPRRKQVERSQSVRAQSPQRIVRRETGAVHASIRRSSSSLSNGNKPPPPVRRTSSITSNTAMSSAHSDGGGVVMRGGEAKTSNSAPGSKQHTPPTQSPTSGHRRSHSESEGGEPPPTAPKPDKQANKHHMVEEKQQHHHHQQQQHGVVIGAAGNKTEVEDVDLPPPPPPEELERDILNATRNSIAPNSGGGVGGGVMNGSVEYGDRSSVLEKAKMFNCVVVAGGGVGTGVGGAQETSSTSSPQRHYATPAMTSSLDSKHYYSVPGGSAGMGVESEQRHYSACSGGGGGSVSGSNGGNSSVIPSAETHYAASDLVVVTGTEEKGGALSQQRKATSTTTPRQGSVVSSHANIITALNQQFAHRPAAPAASSTATATTNKSLVRPTSSPPPPGSYGSMDSDNDITPTAESPNPLSQIKGGIVIRKAYNKRDSSEPRVS